MSKRMEKLEKELNNLSGLERYRLKRDARLEFAKREKNARMKAEETI